MSFLSAWERTRDLFSLILTPLGTPGMRRGVIARAMDLPLDGLIEEYRQKKNLTEADARALARELRRYLAICTICSHEFVPMYGPVDDLWQTLMADKESYADFCMAFA